MTDALSSSTPTTTSAAGNALRPLVPPVVLLGPPGAGKSTAGLLAAARLGFAFVDLDDEIGVNHLRGGGEADFRVRELQALRAALSRGAVVVAAGAGVVDTGPARDALALACCVGVDVDVDTALSRIADGTRPWLPDRNGRDDDARRAAWLRREQGRPTRRAALCVDHVVEDATRKDAARLFELLAALARRGVGRHDRVVVAGGGALLDTGGLAAALHHRGTPWVAVPTTLLSMVDAALGGKTAVDVEVDGVVVRNGAGAFHEPVVTVLDRGFLATLSAAQLRHGRAEMLKHALLAGDDLDAVNDLDDATLARTRAVKRFVVQRDPGEAWLRMCLNLGHTFAHAFESRFGLPHGDAVLHGLRCAVDASVVVAGLDDAFASEARAAIDALRAPALPALDDDDIAALLTAMRRDKKARAGVRLVLLASPARPVLADVDDDVVTGVLRRAGGPGRV